MRAQRGRLAAGVVLLVLVAAACSGGRKVLGPPVTAAGPRSVYVAIGGDESLGGRTRDSLQNSWPQVFYRQSLPINAVFVNAAAYDATVEDELAVQLPIAQDQKPTLVTVIVGAQEELDGDPTPAFASGLTQLLRALRASGNAGKTRVLVGSAVALPSLAPDVRTERQAAFDAVISQAAAATGAQVVPLGAIPASGQQRTGSNGRVDPAFPIGDDGNKAVAAAFGDKS
jgi:hypothetical protein